MRLAPKNKYKYFLLLSILFLTQACNSSEGLRAECTQGIGEACNKLGKELSGEEALAQFRRACDLANTNGCVNLAAQTKDSAEAKRVLTYACDRGNTRACADFAERTLKERTQN